MIIERRAYTFRPGTIPKFWQLQTDASLVEPFARLRSHNLSYFEILAGSADQVVHVYRFESFAEWEEIYAELYVSSAKGYFVEARRLIHAQENAFYRPAPVAGLELGAAGVRTPDLRGLPIDDVLVTERTIQLLPGSLPAFWEAYARYCDSEHELARFNLIGTYFVLVGQIHTVREYRWHANHAAVESFARRLRDSAAHAQFVEAYSPLIVHAHTQLTRPAPIPTHRSLFEESA